MNEAGLKNKKIEVRQTPEDLIEEKRAVGVKAMGIRLTGFNAPKRGSTRGRGKDRVLGGKWPSVEESTSSPSSSSVFCFILPYLMVSPLHLSVCFSLEHVSLFFFSDDGVIYQRSVSE